MARSMPPAWEASFLSYELAEDAAGHSPRSIANRRSAVCSLACWLAEHEGIQSPADVTVPMTQRYFKHAYTVRERSGIRTHYNDLRAFFKHEAAESAKTDQPRSSPMDSIPRPRDVVTPAPILDGKQFAAILASVSGRNFHSLRDRAMILMFAESGMRRAELAALDISDVDIRARTVVIRSGKGGKRRVTFFGTQTAQALLRWQRLHPLLRHGLDDGPLFCVTTGKRLECSAIGYMLRRRGKAAGVTGLRPHLLRHLWAHHCMDSGMQETQIQKLAGWSSGQQLLRYGAALAEQRALDAAHSLDIAAKVLAS